jgi:hypothetical protein
VPEEGQWYVVCEKEMWWCGERFLVLAWRRVCGWCRLCCFGVVGVWGRMVILEGGILLVEGLHVCGVQGLR